MSDKVHKPSIVDGRLDRVSVSQIKAFRACPRSWGFDKIDHEPRPQSLGQKLGSEAHARLEHYLKTGEDVRGPVELAGARLLAPYLEAMPFNGGSARVEAPLLPTMKFQAGPELLGYVDVLIPSPTLPVILDHKITKDIRYAPEAAELREDVQAIVYSWHTLSHCDAPSVKFALHHYQREGSDAAKKAAARETSVFFTREELAPAWARIEKTVEEMTGAAKAKRAAELPANETACRAFGGCPYAAKCENSPHNKLFSSFLTEKKEEDQIMGLLGAVQGFVQQPAPPAPPAPPEPQAAFVKGQGVVYVLPDGRKGAYQTSAMGQAYFTTKDGTPITVPDSLALPVWIEPVVAPPPPAPVEVPAAQLTAVRPPDAPAPDGQASPAPVDDKPKKAKRAKIVDESTPDAVPAVGIPLESPKNLVTSPSSLVAVTKTLFVDCHATGGAVDITPWIYGLADALAKAGGAVDVRLASKDSPLAYGGWKAALAKAALQKLTEIPASAFVSRAELTEPVIDVLAAQAGINVVRPLAR